MNKIRKAKTINFDNRYFFQCPGCNFEHVFTDKWDFNNDFENPTIIPSLLTTWERKGKKYRCHCFIKHGKIQFLKDCTHSLAGETVDLINYE